MSLPKSTANPAVRYAIGKAQTLLYAVCRAAADTTPISRTVKIFSKQRIGLTILDFHYHERVYCLGVKSAGSIPNSLATLRGQYGSRSISRARNTRSA